MSDFKFCCVVFLLKKLKTRRMFSRDSGFQDEIDIDVLNDVTHYKTTYQPGFVAILEHVKMNHFENGMGQHRLQIDTLMEISM